MFRSSLRLPAAFFGLALAFFVFSGAVCEDNETRYAGNGTVRYQNLEGGFWGIIADDGAKYDVVNLSSAYQVDGLRVAFRAKPAANDVSFHMWGTMVEITSIRRLDN